ncbi:THUMP-like domain-containing protein [Aquimarina brevivitae]|uniref:Uncharacterized protein n=1 Tax=Aquimarina brevivitae TaxID=323412 RepID=A0A4Q7NUK5_9FLAO|nr:class I SAM-dependent methyltransferase [Aquimarina brevivitae]RZS90754.1 hypothetical protein EV197_3285 [Aquimarina brevivitae]
MNPRLLHKEVQEYITNQVEDSIDLNKVILAGSPFENITVQELAQQMQGKKIAKQKFPELYHTNTIYYPPKLNLEQTSSQSTALFKSELVSGKKLIDITGGLGIDSYFFSKKVTEVIHCELHTELSTIAKHNFEVLGAKNIKAKNKDGLQELEKELNLDWIYIDPSRRNETKGKVFFLRDCIPNVPVHLSYLFSKADNILLKTAPLLDIKAGIEELAQIASIYVVALNNEVKELLWVLKKDFDAEMQITAVNITNKDVHSYTFDPNTEKSIEPEFGLPETFLYEPNAAIMKAGAFSSIGRSYALRKLHQHSHLYTNQKLIQEFPGRIFKINKVVPYQKKHIQQLNVQKSNITTRNFPLPVAQLRKKLKIKEGGTDYLFFTTNMDNQKIVIHCHKH